MNWRYLTIVIFMIAILHPVSAVVQVHQGDIIYMNETYDITMAVSYPTYQLAWCAPSNYDCDPPDIVIDTDRDDLENYTITPDKFRYGTYYRWDGEWHPAENAVAFTIITGKRPKAQTNATNQSTIQPQIVQKPEGPFNYLVARGDTATLSTTLYEPDNCHLWLFTNTDETYDMDMVADNDTYTTVLNESVTYSLDNGKYSGYIQCNGKNHWQDVFYINGELDTPYDDSMVQDITIPSWNLLNAKRQFDNLITTIPKFDDELKTVTIEVVDPTTTITDVQQDETKLYISGVTSWSEGTPITLQLDPGQYPLERDLMFHTWQTFATGSIDAPRTFATAVPFKRDELFIGTHEIVMKTEKNANTAVSSYAFKVTDVYVMPTPTPEAKRMIYGKDWEEIPVKIEPTPEPTPEETPEETEEIAYEIVINATSNETTVTTPANVSVKNVTTAPTPVATAATQTIPTIPVSAGVCIISVSLAMILRRLP